MQVAHSSCLVGLRTWQAESKQEEGWISALTLPPREVYQCSKEGEKLYSDS